MREYPFQLVNVFAESHFGGNPLAVFPDAAGLSDGDMLQIARQFNLSETVFAFGGSAGAAADLRIFTPDGELPLAGHPMLGAAFVLQQQRGLPENFVLNTRAKPVKLHGVNGSITLHISGYTCEASAVGAAQLAAATGIDADKMAAQAFWVNSGSAQLLLQVYDLAALQHARPDLRALREICQADGHRTVIYLWCEQGEKAFVRLFAEVNGALIEDSGTGSAAANLGAYYAAQGRAPLVRHIYQGDEMGRPNRLCLRVDAEQHIFVGGQVVAVGEGVFRLP